MNGPVVGAPMRIGFVGLGVMGAPMVAHLAVAGHHVTVYDADQAIAPRLAREGAAIRRRGTDVLENAAPEGRIVAANSLRAVAEGAEVVITMLPNGEVVRRVALGAATASGSTQDALIAGLAPGALLLDTSSSEPWLTLATGEALAARGVRMVDAPVSGAQWGAQAADLVFMAGGAAEDIARVRPLLDAMGRAVFHLGPLSSGHRMKCINNTITAATFIATVEGLAIGKRAGLDPVEMNRVLNESTGGSWITRNHIEQRVTSRSFDDPFKLALMSKDIGIAMGVARDGGVPVPLLALTQQSYLAALQASDPQASVSEVARWVEKLTGVPIEPGQGH